MMRPSVALPTGTLIGLPVASTVRPRRRPSEEPIAMVRTTPSPSCCCTSSVRSASLSFNASYTRGMDSRGNSTSMTAPMIWVILPVVAVAIMCSSDERSAVTGEGAPRGAGARKNSNRSRASDNLRELLRDRGLAGFVVDQLQLADELAGVVGGRLHRDHARRHFRGDVLDSTAIHLRFDVAHQQPIENVPRLGLVDVVPVLLQTRSVDVFHRQELLDVRLLRHGVHELRVQQEQPIDLALAIRVEHHLHGADEIVDVRPVAETRNARENRNAQAAEERDALAADEAQRHFRALGLPLAHDLQRLLEDVRVQAAREAA